MNARTPAGGLPLDRTAVSPTMIRWLLDQLGERDLEPLLAMIGPGGGWELCATRDLLDLAMAPGATAWIGQRQTCRGLRSAVYICLDDRCVGRLSAVREPSGAEPVAWRVLLVEVLCTTWYGVT